MARTTAPTNKPITPASIIPPIAPSKITRVGTSTPLPKKIGFKNASDILINTQSTRKIIADVVSRILNPYAATGIKINKGGS